MGLIGDYGHALGLILSPNTSIEKPMNFVNAFGLYYRVSAVPLGILIILELVFGSLVTTILSATVAKIAFLHVLAAIVGTAALVLVVLITVITFWIIGPITILIGAAIYQFVGKFVLKKLKQNYNTTLSATVYGDLPLLVLSWLFIIPFLGVLVLLVAAIWKIIVFVIALSNLHKIGKLAAFEVFIVSAILALVAVVAIASVLVWIF